MVPSRPSISLFVMPARAMTAWMIGSAKISGSDGSSCLGTGRLGIAASFNLPPVRQSSRRDVRHREQSLDLGRTIDLTND
jgi:hypothetical protein